MPVIRIGSCNHCGLCCLPPVMVENPCIERGEDRCKFYTDDDNGELYGHCLIYGRTGIIQKVKDRFGNQITEDQIRWFNKNCIDYPSIADIEGEHQLLPGCSFTSMRVTDGNY